MIISVASGKGGTGKTSVAVALALSLSGPVQLLDCDVEAPNGHIFLNPRWEKKETVYAEIPRVEESRCTYCRACSDLCAFKAILVLGKTILTFPEMCHACGGCFLICEPQALVLDRKELGVIEEGRAGSIYFVHGRLKVGEPMSPPLIRAVKKRIEKGEMGHPGRAPRDLLSGRSDGQGIGLYPFGYGTDPLRSF